MENRLLTQFNSVITSQWLSKQIEEPYDPLIPRELFELAYHTCNSVTMRNIYIKLSPSEDQAGSKAVLYSNTKKFIAVEDYFFFVDFDALQNVRVSADY